MWPILISTVAGAVLSAFLFPFVQWLARIIRARDALKKVFQSPETIRLVPSHVRLGGKASVRDSDHRVASYISSLAQAEHVDDSIPFSFTHPAFPLVIIGSTRYNILAERLQESYYLPFEFIISKHADEPYSRQLTILTRFGEELIASTDSSSLAEGTEVDYAILMVARLGDGRYLFWIAGIHSAGTEGAWQYLKRDSLAVFRQMPQQDRGFIALLIRVRYESRKSSGRPTFEGVESLGPPVRSILMRRDQEQVPTVLLCDLGNVLMEFDRTRTYRAIAHYAPLSWHEVRQRLEKSDLRQRYESGQIETEAFCDEMYILLEIDETVIQRPLLKEFWSDIFWLNREMAHALRHLRERGVLLVLFSNTNPLHFSGVARDYPDIIDLFPFQVLSYEVGHAKPDAQMFEEAIAAVRGGGKKDTSTGQMLMVDDIQSHVDAAKGFGMRALRYRSYSQFVFWVRNQGLYIP